MSSTKKAESRPTNSTIKKSNRQSISNTRSEWFEELGHLLQGLLEDTCCPTPTANDLSIHRLVPFPKPTYTAENGLVDTAMTISAQQLVSYALPVSSNRPYPKPSQLSLQTNETKKVLKYLLMRFGGVSHMVLTDKSYEIFISTEVQGALCYKLHHDVAVICGDPLCELKSYARILQEFQTKKQLSTKRIAFLGVSDEFRLYAASRRWISLNFGVERSINPITNSILAGACSKRIYAQSRQLLDPKRGGLQLLIYKPDEERNALLEAQMMAVYEDWRVSREGSAKVQSYLTLLDFGAYPGELFYLYAKNENGEIHGFAGLRKLGADKGYHLDPCIEATFAQRGVADLLVVASMALLRSLNIGSLSLGYEPLAELSSVAGATTVSSRILRSLYQEANQILNLEGKRKHNDRFKPDDSQTTSLYIILPTRKLPRIQQLLAVAATVHLDVRHIVKSGFGFWEWWT